MIENVVRERMLNIIPFPILMLEQNMTIIYCNQAYAEFVSKHAPELIGKNLLQLFPEFKRTKSYATYLDTFETKTPHEVEETFENRFLHAWIYPLELGILAIMDDQTERKQFENALCESEEKYRTLVEQSLQGIVIMQDSRIVFTNKAFAEMSGYSIDELLALFPEEVKNRVHVKDQELVWGRMQGLLEGQSPPQRYEFRGVRKEGSIRWFEMFVTLIAYRGKTAVQGVLVDISERKYAHEVQLLLHSIANLVNTTKDLNELFKAIQDKLGEIIDTTNFYVALYNREDDTITLPYFIDEKDSYRTFPAGKTLTSYVIKHNKPLLATEEITRRMTVAGEVEIIGSPSKVWLGVPLKIGTEVIGVLAVQSYTDPEFYTEKDLEILQFVSDQIALAIERKRAEKALKESEKKYRATVEQSAEGIYILDFDSKQVLEANSSLQNLLGYSSEELKVLTIYDFVDHPREDIDGKINEVIAKKLMFLGPRKYRHKDGKIIDVEVGASYITYGSKKAISVVSRDITERKKAEENLKKSLSKLQETIESTVEAVARIVEIRDPYTAGHQRRVADLAFAIAKEMGLPEKQANGIKMAALVHDVGKLYIPAEILVKPTTLTEIEFGMVKTHPRVGYEILKTVKFPWPVADIILQHHERCDGSGYLQGLKKEKILLEARILAVADVVEAMSSHRPYRPARGLDKTLAEITKNKGMLYDPDVVGACLRVFQEKGFAFQQYKT